ncbi:MAG TPA: thymidylate kinase [Oscillospiraceae bacterium]|nr:thymidylate kinase [Oscillospiraceae bacterium]
MRGKLIVIDSGGDASGKKTQTELLFARLSAEGRPVRQVTFPNYDSPASALVKMYLGGAFGTRPEDVSPYVSSTFFAVDRYAAYRTQWGDFYEGGGIILCDRYTTSNMVHMTAKIEGAEAQSAFLDWLWNFEFGLFALPVPDMVFFLDVPPEQAHALMAHRRNKITGGDEKDIHERDDAYLARCYEAARMVASKYGWVRIPCTRDGAMRSVEEIHAMIYDKVLPVLNP